MCGSGVIVHSKLSSPLRRVFKGKGRSLVFIQAVPALCGGLALMLGMAWVNPALSKAPPPVLEPAQQGAITLAASFPPTSGPGRFLNAWAEQLNKAGAPVMLQDRTLGRQSLATGDFDGYVLSDQELFPPIRAQRSDIEPIEIQLRPVAPLLVNPFFVVVARDGGYATMQQLVETAVARPGVVRYGSWGPQSPGRTYGALLAREVGAHMVHIAYPSLADLYDALGRQEIDWALGTSIGPAAAAHQAGKIRYLAIADGRRDAELDVPTLDEVGLPPGLYFRAWLGLFGPAHAETSRVQQLAQHAAAIPDLLRRYPSMPLPDQVRPEVLQRYMDDAKALNHR